MAVVKETMKRKAPPRPRLSLDSESEEGNSSVGNSSRLPDKKMRGTNHMTDSNASCIESDEAMDILTAADLQEEASCSASPTCLENNPLASIPHPSVENTATRVMMEIQGLRV